MSGHLDAEDLLLLIAQSTAPKTRIRDGTILYASAERPEATFMGDRVLHSLPDRAAALLHSIIRWEPLELWNSSFAWHALFTLADVNGADWAITAWDRMVISNEIIEGRLDDIGDISSRLAPFLRYR